MPDLPPLRAHQWIESGFDSVRTGWLVGLDKASLSSVIGFITVHCEIRSLTGICSIFRTIAEYVAIEEELVTVEHLLYNWPALSKLRLRTLDRGFCEGLNSVSVAEAG